MNEEQKKDNNQSQNKQSNLSDDQSLAASQRDIKDIKDIEDIQEENEELLNKYKRALADYDNLKKETAKEREEMGKFAMGMAAVTFLEVFENLKKALSHNSNLGDITKEIQEIQEIQEIEGKLLPKIEKARQWTEGIGHIKNQFAEVLKQMGVEEIKTVGEKFDPKLHEAVGEEKIEGKEPGLIVREVEGGYKMGERVVKAAKVIVSK